MNFYNLDTAWFGIEEQIVALGGRDMQNVEVVCDE